MQDKARTLIAEARGEIATPMSMVEGKVAFITGGSSGIGLGIARAFADAGMKVVFSYRTDAHLNEAMHYLPHSADRIHAIKVDVTDRIGMQAAAEETVQKFGKVHVLVNNAGVVVAKPVSESTYEDWDWLMAINLDGVFNGIRAFLPHIQAHGEGGHVIATSSIMGLFVVKNGGLYSASKFGVVGLMEALRFEMLVTNIGVSVFCPGNVWGNIHDSSRNRPSSSATDDVNAQSEEQKAEAQKARVKLKSENYEVGMDPLVAGQLVLRGMQNNDLYILSHPELGRRIKERNEAIEASHPSDLRAPEARVKDANINYDNPMYVLERDRRRSVKSSG